MAAATRVRRQFVAALDAQRGTFATDGATLYEVIATRQLLPTRDGYRVDGPDAAVKLLDCARDLPADRIEELEAAVWIAVEEAEGLDVVEAMRDHRSR